MTSTALLNLFAWSLQVAVVVAAAAVIARVLHVDAPGARYAWWRFVLVMCLALPALQPWPHSTATVEKLSLADGRGDTTSQGLTGAGGVPTGAPILSARRGAAAALIFVTLVVGSLLRFAWLLLTSRLIYS